MSFLTLLLFTKIALTAVAVLIPLLIAPGAWLSKVFGGRGGPVVVYRLYGVAIAALLVGYGFGVRPAMAGIFPMAAVTMGMVSNAGAVVILLGSKARRKPLIRLGAAFFGAVAVGLAFAMIAPELALSPLWNGAG
jgi:hypothetical protein